MCNDQGSENGWKLGNKYIFKCSQMYLCLLGQHLNMKRDDLWENEDLQML